MKKKIILGSLFAIFLILLVPINSAIELKTVENHNINVVEEKQNDLIKNPLIRKDAILLTNVFKNVFKNLILIEKIGQRYEQDEQDVSLDELIVIKNSLESSFYILKDLIIKHDLTSINPEIELYINNAESSLNELTLLVENNPEELGIIIQSIRVIVASFLFVFLLFFDIIFYIFFGLGIVLYYMILFLFIFILLPVLIILYIFPELRDEILYIILYAVYRPIIVGAIPWFITNIPLMVLDSGGKISFKEATEMVKEAYNEWARNLFPH